MKANSIEGRAYKDKVTKRLINYIPNKSIAIIEHEDLDRVAAEDLIRKNVKAVVNKKVSYTGLLPISGVEMLLKAAIPVFDLFCDDTTSLPMSFDLKIDHINCYFKSENDWKWLGYLHFYHQDEVERLKNRANSQMKWIFHDFALNTLHHASNELDLFLDSYQKLPKFSYLTNRKVWVVTRSFEVSKKLAMFRPYLVQEDTVIIAVDGATHRLEDIDIQPNFIVGDMDSLSYPHKCSRSIFIPHAYLNGTSPGEARLKNLSIDGIRPIPFPGLSEDLAMLLAYRAGAKQIFSIGGKDSSVEFLEKGRSGMGSTILTKMLIGDRLTTLKSVTDFFIIQSEYSPFENAASLFINEEEWLYES